jgi:hypothetical protein
MNHRTLTAWWSTRPLPGNLGDILSPLLIKRLYDYELKYDSSFDKHHLLAVGSILSKATGKSTVWGSGIINSSEVPSREARYLAVRGPLSYERIIQVGGKCPEVFGDPALLLPLVHAPDISKKYKLGIIPHYVDYDTVRQWYSDTDIPVINILNADPLSVVDQILECENIISSSLHGLIISNAYGIPAKWVKFSNKLVGDDVKFLDYHASVNMKDKFEPIMERINPIDLLKFDFKKFDHYDATPLLNSFIDHPIGITKCTLP